MKNNKCKAFANKKSNTKNLQEKIFKMYNKNHLCVCCLWGTPTFKASACLRAIVLLKPGTFNFSF